MSHLLDKLISNQQGQVPKVSCLTLCLVFFLFMLKFSSIIILARKKLHQYDMKDTKVSKISWLRERLDSIWIQIKYPKDNASGRVFEGLKHHIILLQLLCFENNYLPELLHRPLLYESKTEISHKEFTTSRKRRRACIRRLNMHSSWFFFSGKAKIAFLSVVLLSACHKKWADI